MTAQQSLTDYDVASQDRYAALVAQMQTLQNELEQAQDKIRNLDVALSTSRGIGMAIGIVMARRGLASEAAFAALRYVSQRTHRKLRDVADEVVLTGELPAA